MPDTAHAGITFTDEHLAAAVAELASDPRLGLPVQPMRRVLIDYSSPNMAKEMHVGHLRSTIIGDALVRIFEELGHEVVRQNHLGDWGTQFGMLVEYMVAEGLVGAQFAVADLTGFYTSARARFNADEAFAERARKRVVLLQAGDPDTLSCTLEVTENVTTNGGGRSDLRGVRARAVTEHRSGPASPVP